MTFEQALQHLKEVAPGLNSFTLTWFSSFAGWRAEIALDEGDDTRDFLSRGDTPEQAVARLASKVERSLGRDPVIITMVPRCEARPARNPFGDEVSA